MLYITNEWIYFQPYHNIYDTQVISFSIKRFQDFFKRRFKLIDIGLQLVLQKNNDTPKTLYIAFDNVNDRNAIYDAVSGYNSFESRAKFLWRLQKFMLFEDQDGSRNNRKLKKNNKRAFYK